jgi:hypothetical protein
MSGPDDECNGSLLPDANDTTFDDPCNPSSPDDGPWGPGNGPNGSYCDLNIEDNVWVEGVVDLSASPQKRGICMLDTMSRQQVAYVLQHDPRARCDLPKVTSNPQLLAYLDQVQLLPTGNHADAQQRRANSRPGGLPFYNQFGGRPPYKPGNSQ